MTLRTLLNVAYQVLTEGRDQQAVTILDDQLNSPFPSEETDADRAMAERRRRAMANTGTFAAVARRAG